MLEENIILVIVELTELRMKVMQVTSQWMVRCLYGDILDMDG